MAESKTEKPAKINKAPGFYRKRISEELLKRKYLKYLEVPVDKAFITGCYEKREDALYIRTDLSKEDIKRLKFLKAGIKKNRKAVINLLPIGICAAVVAAIVIFFTIFANPLLQKALEAGLEAVFEAKVNADRFRISLFKFEIAMNSLTIADRDHPMKNLIQFSTMRIKLKPAAIMRGKVYIEEIRADHIRFGTDRTVSGALPGKAPKQKNQEEFTIPAMVDLKNFDAMALLNEEFDKLLTPKLYDDALAAYETAVIKWKGEEEAARARVAEIQTLAEPLLKINVNDYKTLDENTITQIRTTISEVNALVDTVQGARNDVSRIVSGVQEDFNTASALEQSARNAITTDFNHLRSYLDFGGGALQEVVEPVVMSILTDSAMSYIDYGQRALEILEKVKELQAMIPKSEPKPKVEKFKGRDVIFPTYQYPRFFMGVLATDVLTPNDWHWGFDLKGVSSDPDLSGVPTSLALSLAETGDGQHRSGAFNGRADFRSNASERFNADLSGAGFPVDIRAALSKIGMDGFSGESSFSINALGNTDGSFASGAEISVSGARITNPTNTFTQAADEAIRQVSSVNLGIRYEHVLEGKDQFSVTTNITDILRDAISRIVSQYLKQAEDALEKALREKIDQYIDGKFVSKDEVDLIIRLARGDLSAMDDLKNSLDKKKNELEDRIKSAATQVVEEAKEQAQQAAQQAVQDVLQGNTPSVPSSSSASSTLQNLFGR